MLRIVFFGDSITAANKSETVPLGTGFVSMLASHSSNDSILKPIDIINSGINGHTVQDLLHRVEVDVISFVPDIIVIKIGINDAYNDYINGINPRNIQNFKSAYQKLLQQLQLECPAAKIFLLTPYYISDSQTDALYQVMTKYRNIVHQLSTENGLPLLDTQKIFDDAIHIKPAKEWAEDQIHPSPEGHELLARSVYDFLFEYIIH